MTLCMYVYYNRIRARKRQRKFRAHLTGEVEVGVEVVSTSSSRWRQGNHNHSHNHHPMVAKAPPALVVPALRSVWGQSDLGIEGQAAGIGIERGTGRGSNLGTESLQRRPPHRPRHMMSWTTTSTKWRARNYEILSERHPLTTILTNPV